MTGGVTDGCCVLGARRAGDTACSEAPGGKWGAHVPVRVGVSRTPRQGRGGCVRVRARRWGGPKPLAREIRPAGEEGREFQARVRERSLGTCARCSAVRAPSPALLIGTWSSSVF